MIQECLTVRKLILSISSLLIIYNQTWVGFWTFDWYWEESGVGAIPDEDAPDGGGQGEGWGDILGEWWRLVHRMEAGGVRQQAVAGSLQAQSFLVVHPPA
jgi:hypothetical protein